LPADCHGLGISSRLAFLSAENPASCSRRKRQVVLAYNFLDYWFMAQRLARYRAAGSVLPVTKALLSSLHRRSITANLAYPGTSVGPVKDRGSSEIRLLMAAVDLNEPRKRIPWMLDAMKGMQPPSGTTLQLVGNPDSSVMRAADQLGFPVEFLAISCARISRRSCRTRISSASDHSLTTGLCLGGGDGQWLGARGSRYKPVQ